jgi:multimeric flavodoxin WrbA
LDWINFTRSDRERAIIRHKKTVIWHLIDWNTSGIIKLVWQNRIVKVETKMMVLSIVGSSRKSGNTDQLIALIETEMQSAAALRHIPIEIERINLGDYNLQPCRGCRACFDRGEEKCPVKDGILELKARMLAADVLVIGTPVYTNDVSGMVKNWLDRLAHLNHRPEFGGKYAYIIATVGSSPVSHAMQTLSQNMAIWGFYLVGKAGFKMGARMLPEETRARFGNRAAGIARTLLSAVTDQRALQPSFYSLMVFKIVQRV